MSSTVKATESEQKELYDMASNIPFDDRMNYEAELQDLKLPLIQNYLYKIKVICWLNLKKWTSLICVKV